MLKRTGDPFKVPVPEPGKNARNSPSGTGGDNTLNRSLETLSLVAGRATVRIGAIGQTPADQRFPDATLDSANRFALASPQSYANAMAISGPDDGLQQFFTHEENFMPDPLMILPSKNYRQIRLVRVPEDTEQHEIYRHATGVIAEIEEQNPDCTGDEILEALEEHGFASVEFILGPELD